MLMQPTRSAIRNLVTTIILGLATPAALAANDEPEAPCHTSMAKGQICRLAIDEMRPTQLTYGAIEVHQRAVEFAAKSSNKMQEYLYKNPAPVIVSPDGHYYITDGHHMVLSYAQIAGNSATVYVQIQENWSSLTQAAFWQQMTDAEYVYLYDENGAGPYAIVDLGADLFGLHDDAYRSLAWGVRKNNGYDDTSVSHADFLWADFLRSRIDIATVNTDFDDAIDTGTKYAQSAAAKSLPGYTGKQ